MGAIRYLYIFGLGLDLLAVLVNASTLLSKIKNKA